jgi:hypothetical protein
MQNLELTGTSSTILIGSRSAMGASQGHQANGKSFGNGNFILCHKGNTRMRANSVRDERLRGQRSNVNQSQGLLRVR